MAYATTADLFAEWGEENARRLARRASAETDQQIDARITSALAEADNFINTYISAAVSLPLAQIPPILKDVAVDIAFHKISGQNGVTPQVRAVYDERVRFLRDIANGRASFGLNATGTGEVSSESQSGAIAQPSSDFPIEDLNRRAV